MTELNKPKESYSKFLDRIFLAPKIIWEQQSEHQLKQRFQSAWTAKNRGIVEIRFLPFWDDAEKWVQEFFGSRKQCLYVCTGPMVGEGEKLDHLGLGSRSKDHLFSERIRVITEYDGYSSIWGEITVATILTTSFVPEPYFEISILKAVVHEVCDFFIKEGYEVRCS